MDKTLARLREAREALIEGYLASGEEVPKMILAELDRLIAELEKLGAT